MSLLPCKRRILILFDPVNVTYDPVNVTYDPVNVTYDPVNVTDYNKLSIIFNILKVLNSLNI